jgi:hypothetical protein
MGADFIQIGLQIGQLVLELAPVKRQNIEELAQLRAGAWHAA